MLLKSNIKNVGIFAFFLCLIIFMDNALLSKACEDDGKAAVLVNSRIEKQEAGSFFVVLPAVSVKLEWNEESQLYEGTYDIKIGMPEGHKNAGISVKPEKEKILMTAQQSGITKEAEVCQEKTLWEGSDIPVCDSADKAKSVVTGQIRADLSGTDMYSGEVVFEIDYISHE